MRSPAVRQCRASIARNSKSFALASKLLPSRARDEAAVVYAWCRRADDAIDGVPPAQQVSALARLRAELAAIEAGAPHTDPVLQAFAEVVGTCSIPTAYPSALLDGMEMDAQGFEYRSRDDLLLYCYRVASTVGLMMCHVMGVRDPSAVRHAAHLGLAMQLTNICRDVHEDWLLGRLYMPRELLAEHGLQDLRDQLGGPFPQDARAPMAAVVTQLLQEASSFYASADRGLLALDVRSAWAVRTARKVYAAIGDKLAAMDCDVLAGRAVVPTPDKLKLAADAAWLSARELPSRIRKNLAGERVRRSNMPARVRFPADILPL